MAGKSSLAPVMRAAHVAFSDPVDVTAPVRMLVIADGFGATQQISFLTPLESWRASGVAVIRILEERALNNLRERGPEVLARFLEAEFAALKPTIVVLSRYSGPDYPLLFSLARERGAPVVLHLDDDLFEAPITLGVDLYQRLRRPHRVHALYRIAEAADAVYVSTAALGERVRRRVKPKRLVVAGIYVGAGRVPPAPRPVRADPDEVRIGYMASAGHAFDFELVTPALFSILERFPKVRLYLFGTIVNTEAAQEFGDRMVKHRRITGDYAAFRAAMATLDWDIGLAPLAQSGFNACRAPTKWVEYAEAGIATLASDHSVYRPLARAGALTVCSDTGWEQAITELIASPDRRSALIERSRAVLASDYRWDRVEAQVIDLIAMFDPAVMAPA